MKLYSFFPVIFFAFTLHAQSFQRDFPLADNGIIQITNLYGRVSVEAQAEKEIVEAETEVTSDKTGKVFLTSENAKESDLKIVNGNNRLEIIVAPTTAQSRIDLKLTIPGGTKVKIETRDGEVRLEGKIESAEIKTETGTIAVNVPLDDLKYDFVWTESRPRFLSDVALEEADEKAAGKFVINGKLGEKVKSKKSKVKSEEVIEGSEENENAENQIT